MDRPGDGLQVPHTTWVLLEALRQSGAIGINHEKVALTREKEEQRQSLTSPSLDCEAGSCTVSRRLCGFSHPNGCVTPSCTWESVICTEDCSVLSQLNGRRDPKWSGSTQEAKPAEGDGRFAAQWRLLTGDSSTRPSSMVCSEVKALSAEQSQSVSTSLFPRTFGCLGSSGQVHCPSPFDVTPLQAVDAPSLNISGASRVQDGERMHAVDSSAATFSDFECLPSFNHCKNVPWQALKASQPACLAGLSSKTNASNSRQVEGTFHGALASIPSCEGFPDPQACPHDKRADSAPNSKEWMRSSFSSSIGVTTLIESVVDCSVNCGESGNGASVEGTGHSPSEERLRLQALTLKEKSPDPALLDQALLDCYGRFITLLPEALLRDHVHLYFQIQQAYWWYMDMWVDRYSTQLPHLSFKDFGFLACCDCPLLRHYVPAGAHNKFMCSWRMYCRTIPLRGAIVLNGDLTKCLLVTVGRKDSA